MTPKPLLKITDLNLRFKLFEGVSHVLAGVNLEVRRGERVAVVGESGCGKSVTLRLILGLLRGNNIMISGKIEFDDLEINTASETKLREIRGRRIGTIFKTRWLHSIRPLQFSIKWAR